MPLSQPGEDRAAERDPAGPQRPRRAPRAPAVHPVLLLGAQEPVPQRREQDEDRPRQRPPPDRAGAQEQPHPLGDRGRGVPDARQARLGQPGAPEQDRRGGRGGGDCGGDEVAPLAAQRVAAGRAGPRRPRLEQLWRPAAHRPGRRHPGDDRGHEPLCRERGVPAEVRPRPRQLRLPGGQPGEDRAVGRDHAGHCSDGEALEPPAVPPVLLLGAQEPVAQRGEQEAHRRRPRPAADRGGAAELPGARWDRGGGVWVHPEAGVGQRGEPEQGRAGGRD
mmetsp:Transcript_12497/g.29955  ORF Transcript_12497/g.29955 Transcript_12497/m.29955 type:complete len:277 (+) Transcript_12497:1439-2269(+)